MASIAAAWTVVVQGIAGLFGMIGLTVVGLSQVTALAAVALIGYIVGRTQLRHIELEASMAQEETQAMIDQLETVSKQIRQSLAMQHASIRAFREKVRSLCEVDDDATREQLVEQAERILQPTAELSSEIVHAYETIRRETGSLKRIGRKARDTALQR